MADEVLAGSFEAATAVQFAGNGPEPGWDRYTGDVGPGWDYAGATNGGYLMAMAARAMAASCGHPPLTITCHFLRPAPAGPAEVMVETVRSGRRLSTMAATLSVDGKPVVRVLGTFGDIVTDPVLTTVAAPGGASFDECRRDRVDADDRPTTASGPAFLDRVDIRLQPGDEGFARGEPTGRAEMAGWFAFRDGTPLDPFALLFAVDVFAPSIFNFSGATLWVPTVELTVHVRGVPAPGPVQARFRSAHVAGGMLGEDGDVWDSEGRLVAQSRQLALMPR